MVNWLRNNLNLKLLALVLAIMLWMVVNMNNRVTQPINPLSPPISQNTISRVIENVPIKPKLDDDRMVIANMTKFVNLSIKGERSALEGGIFPARYEAYVDLNGLSAGTHKVPIRVSGFPLGFEIVANPAAIDVTLELKKQKEMPVTVEMTGKPKDGYLPGQPAVSPLNVQVTASENQLNKIVLIKGFINIEGAEDEVKKKVPLKAIDAEGNEVEAVINPAVVDVALPILRPSLRLPLQIKVTGSPPEGFALRKITANPSTLSIFGDKNLWDGGDTYPGPEIDLSGMNKTTVLDLPIPNPKGLDISPQKVKITVEIIPSVKKDFANIPIEMTGLPAGLTAKILDPADGKLKVTLEGAPEAVGQVTPDQLKATVSLNGLAPGTHSLPVTLSLPNNVKLLGGEIRVSVEVTDATKPATGTPEPPPQEGSPPNQQKPPSGNGGATQGGGT